MQISNTGSDMEDMSVPSENMDTPNNFVAMAADINTAAALRAQYAIETPKPTRRRRRKGDYIDEDTPIVDTTQAMPLHSKKTERMQKRQQKRCERAATRAASTSLLDLPSELLTQVCSELQPSDLFSVIRTSRSLHSIVLAHQDVIARDIMRRRYSTLRRCFPTPIFFKDVPEAAHAALLSEKRQEMLNIHRKSYHQHVQMVDPHVICTCMTCVFAWNNLCLILDLNHWQHNLDNREPIPMIPRGSHPEWNQALLRKHACIVEDAMVRPLTYARILEKHLSTITRTITRMSKTRSRPKTSATTGTGTGTGTHKPGRLYNMTDADMASGTDEFLNRSGPPSYDFPFHRDIYYHLDVYLPNRKWSNESKQWHYYANPPAQHERDLEWVMSFTDKKRRVEKEIKSRVGDASVTA